MFGPEQLVLLQRLIWRCLIETVKSGAFRAYPARLQRLIWRCLIETALLSYLQPRPWSCCSV